MYNTSKICDAADWFDPEIKLIIENELREPAKFHRKQWEFAMIFLTLQKLGLLNENKVGLSVGGGNERVLYSIANHIKKLFVTDLYDDATSWDCARTKDPDVFIKVSKPFPVDDNKIQALRMDMRDLDFNNNTVDFCYSSCAIEHIGNYQDFIQHFDEVNRVLKEGGIYVLTTELQFGNKTIQDENNFVFTKEYISDLITNSKLELVEEINLELTNNIINYPYPSNIKSLAFSGDNNLNQKLFEQFPHLMLLRGNVPFTSVLLILRKGDQRKKSIPIKFTNYYTTEKFLMKGVENYKKLIEENKIQIFPFSVLPGNVSKYFLDHSEYFSDLTDEEIKADTIFHTDYFWFGEGEREINLKMQVENIISNDDNEIQLRLHSYPIYDSGNIKCTYEKNIKVRHAEQIEEKIEFTTMENSNYSIVCKMISGDICFNSIMIESSKIEFTNNKKFNMKELEGVIE